MSRLKEQHKKILLSIRTPLNGFSHFDFLEFIVKNPSSSIFDISEMSGIDISITSKAIAAFERCGMVLYFGSRNKRAVMATKLGAKIYKDVIGWGSG